MAFAKAFVNQESDQFSEKEYAAVLGKMLVFIFRQHKKYINVDSFKR